MVRREGVYVLVCMMSVDVHAHSFCALFSDVQSREHVHTRRSTWPHATHALVLGLVLGLKAYNVHELRMCQSHCRKENVEVSQLVHQQRMYDWSDCCDEFG